jgi:aldehyde dehydrogenase (NAD+)
MSAAVVESRSPQAPGELILSRPAVDRRGVADAFVAAREAAAAWQRSPASERADALTSAAATVAANAEELCDLVVREVGKPVVEARGEIARAVSILRFHAQAAIFGDGETHPTLPPLAGDAIVMSRRRPRGVAGLITPWNFPIAIPLWKAAPALAYGNAVVLKPSPQATATALRVAEMIGEHLPADVFTVLPGDRETGEALVAEADVLSFTGSTLVGQTIIRAAAERGITIQCEMGGCNASIVLPDADVESAARTIVASAMGYAGQKCTATSRIIVVGNPVPLTEALAAAVDTLLVGDPSDPSTVVGPVISEAARDRVLAAARDGGRVIRGGTAAEADGYFVAPTLVDSLSPDALLLREEVFGPVAAILSAPDCNQAVALNAGVPHGLVTSVFTADLDAALWFAAELRTGMIRINQPTSGVDFHAPFGGEGSSSYGPREQGLAARELYTTTHTITVAPTGAYAGGRLRRG